jgi:hypothetical protein
MLQTLDSLSDEVYLLDLHLADRIRRGDFAGGPQQDCATRYLRDAEDSAAVLQRVKLLMDPTDTIARPQPNHRVLLTWPSASQATAG